MRLEEGEVFWDPFAAAEGAVVVSGSDKDAFRFLGKGCGGGCINIGNGNEDQKHHSDFPDFAPVFLHGVSVTKLMKKFDKRIHKHEQDQRFRHEDTVQKIGGQRFPMAACRNGRSDQQRNVKHCAKDRKNRFEKRPCFGDERIGVHQRESHRERVHEAGKKGPASLFIAPCNEARSVWQAVGRQKIKHVHL